MGSLESLLTNGDVWSTWKFGKIRKHSGDLLLLFSRHINRHYCLVEFDEHRHCPAKTRRIVYDPVLYMNSILLYSHDLHIVTAISLARHLKSRLQQSIEIPLNTRRCFILSRKQTYRHRSPLFVVRLLSATIPL